MAQLNQNNSSLSRRSIGAVVVFFPTVITAWLGGWWFAALIFVVCLLATRELIDLMRASGFALHAAIAYGAFAALFAASLFQSWWLIALTLSAIFLGSLAWQMRERGASPIATWAIALAGGGYLGWCGGHLAAVRLIEPNGWWWLVLTVATTWIADSGAYFVGKSIGKHKLAPMLSPKKTWEGYIGGIVTGVLCGAVVGLMAPMPMWQCVATSFIVSVFGTFGDLAESMFKRQANAKDSGSLIPGMGGAFDRIDSLLWAGVLVFYFARWVNG